MEKSSKFLQFIKYLLFGGIFLVPFIPLIVSSSLFFPFITGKNFAFRFLVELILGLWLVLAIYEPKYRPRSSWISAFLLGFVAILALSAIFGENFYRSFWSNYERMEGLVTHLHLLAYFFVLISVFNPLVGGEKLWKRFFHTSLGVSLIMGIYGLVQLGGGAAIHQGSTRLDASMGNSAYLAIYMVFNFFIALFYFARTHEWYKWFYVPLMALQAIVLYYTATRGAILGFIGGLFLTVLVIALLSKRGRVKTLSFGALALIILSLGGFWTIKDATFIKESPVLSRFSSISLEETTTQSRFVIWKMSWEGFKEKPLLGWGPENYNLVFNKYYEPILYKQEPWFDRAHNVFFDRLTTNGVFGLIAYLGLFFVALYYLLFKRRDDDASPDTNGGFSVYDAAILTGLLGAYLVHNLFVFDSIISFILFFAVLGYIHHRATFGKSADLGERKTSDAYTKQALSVVVLVGTLFIMYNVNVPGFLASQSLLGSFQENAMGNTETAFQKFEKAISYNSFGTTEAREHLINFASGVIANPNTSQEFKQKVFSFAVSEMQKQIAQSPTDIRYLIFLGSLYNKGEQYNEAIKVLEKAIELAPKKQMLYFELGTAYINTQQYDKAVGLMRTAFELEPSSDDARTIYAISLIYADKDNEVDKVLKARYGDEIITDQRLLNAYVANEKFDKAAVIVKKLLEKNPNDVQLRLNLTAAYLQMGDRQQAIKEIQKIIEIKPDFKKQGEYYISEISAGRNP